MSMRETKFNTAAWAAPAHRHPLKNGVEDENSDPVGDGHSDADYAATHPKPRGPHPSPEPDGPAPVEPIEPDDSGGESPDDAGDRVPRRGVRR